MNIQDRLKAIRIDSDLSQQEIADYLKIDRKTYCRYENSHHEIKIETLIQLAKYYQVSLDYLAGLTNVPRQLEEKNITLKNKNVTFKKAGDEIRIILTNAKENNKQGE